MSLSNASLSELLARAAPREEASHRQRALRRASRAAAFWWEEEAADLLRAGRSLTELEAVGPWVAHLLQELFDDPPEAEEVDALRLGFLTLSEVRASLADEPSWAAEVRADLQMHTTYSDGKMPPREMAEACMAIGYEFIALTDHSQSLKIANGMSPSRLAEQGRVIDELNDSLAGLRVLKSIEMDIHPDGREDMEAADLEPLDLVLGAFHSKLRLKEDQTLRYLAAMRTPHVNVLAHPRGRRYDFRLGLWCDWERVFAEAVVRRKAVEIDAYPDRQDLNVDLLRLAAEAGALISIGTDAHHTSELRFLEFGLAAAIRAGVPRSRILNFWTADEVVAWARSSRV